MKRSLKIIALALLSLPLGVSCEKEHREAGKPEPVEIPIDWSKRAMSVKELADMSLHEKVCQMFFVRPESLTPGVWTSAIGATVSNFEKYPVGGFLLFAGNIVNPKQLRSFNNQLHRLGNYPLIAVDEEGGTVARIGKNKNFSVPTYDNMYSVGQKNDLDYSYSVGLSIGSYVAENGFDIDFAPVTDVFTNPGNKVIGKRAFGSEPELVARNVERFVRAFSAAGICSCLKHFPGHGDTGTDSHTGYAETGKSWEEMLHCEIIPFRAGVAAGTDFIMSAHIAAPAVTGNKEPSTLSRMMMTDKLRGELDFKGIIVSDGMEMGAITQHYSSDVAAVKAVGAGVDMILVPADYKKAIDAVEAAVRTGSITESRINESVERIMKLKKRLLENRLK